VALRIVERRAFSLKVWKSVRSNRVLGGTYAAQLNQGAEGAEIQDKVSAGNRVTSDISKSPCSLFPNIFTL
jgi:hypothetical protein